MASAFEIPTSPTPQKFSVSLSGVTRELMLHWDAPAACWIMDIADDTGTPILSGIPLITGADLLAQYAYAGLAGIMLVQTDHDPDAVPTFANLGTAGHLFFASTGAGA